MRRITAGIFTGPASASNRRRQAPKTWPRFGRAASAGYKAKRVAIQATYRPDALDA